MADCASLLDEELSSFVFNYLTENSDSQYGEEEVCSDRLDSDFPDIDLSQLDASDFDSVNCLSELHWCNDQPVDGSPDSACYSTTDELFEIEEENAALLAALTDSLDGMVDAEVGGLSVFPALGEEPDQEEEEDNSLPLKTSYFGQSLGAETEDLSLLRKLLLTPPNVPTGIDAHKDGSHGHRHGNRSVHLRPFRPLVKSDIPQERKPRAVRPAGRLCTELHRHLTTAQDTEDTPALDTEEDEEEEEEEEDEEEDSESEEDEEEEEEEEESSSSEAEGATVAAPAVPAEPAEPQFSSEKELQSVVELIRYMHTYCLPTRKQQVWERRERELPGLARSRARPEASRGAQNSHGKVVLVGGPGVAAVTGGNPAPRRLPFARRREVKANSLLQELLQQSASFDVSKPYRLHRPPYSRSHSPLRGGHAPSSLAKPLPASASSSASPASRTSKPELGNDSSSSSPERRTLGASSSFSSSLEAPQSPGGAVEEEDGGGSFSVRRSRRLASFPSRFAKRLRPGRGRVGDGKREEKEEEARAGIKLLPTQAGGVTTVELPAEHLRPSDAGTGQETTESCCHSEKRACLCLPLNSKSTGQSQYSTKSFEQTLSVDLCGTAGLTPPTTPPHKPVEDELFKPAEGGKGGGGGCCNRDGDAPLPPTPALSNANASSRASSWLSRAHHQRKLPEQTELYAQLRRMGQAGEAELEGPPARGAGSAVVHRTFGDHDYCAPSLGESRKRNAAVLSAILRGSRGGEGLAGGAEPKRKEGEDLPAASEKLPEQQQQQQQQQAGPTMSSSSPASSDCQSAAGTPPASEEEGERSSASRSPSPLLLHPSPDSPASKTDSSSENSESCSEDKRNKVKSDEDNCQVFYIHNLPSSVTQNMLRKRFQVFGNTEDCKVIIRNEERCGVIKIRQAGVQRHRREREALFHNGAGGLRRLTRKRYIDLDEAGPGPVKSKYDALDFDTLLKEAQKSLHR